MENFVYESNKIDANTACKPPGHFKRARHSKKKKLKRKMEELKTHGVCVVPNVLSIDECNHFLERVREGETHAHSRLMWDIRTHSNVLKCFEQVWKTDRLIVGYDGVGYGHPSDLDWHTDQDFNSSYCACVQGILALSSASSTEFDLDSHITHVGDPVEDIAEGQWQFRYTNVRHNARIFRPQLSPGDLLLWDSRTTHRVVAGSEVRCVVYLSMVPLSFASTETLKQRRVFYEKGIATTHWPHLLVDRKSRRVKPHVRYEKASCKVKSLIDGEL